MTEYSEVPNSRAPMSSIAVHSRPRCVFPTAPSEIAAGVWHCAKCEAQLATVQVWARCICHYLHMQTTSSLAKLSISCTLSFGSPQRVHALLLSTLLVQGSWAPLVATNYLASRKGREASGPTLGARLPGVLDTGGDKDDYLSTLEKGFVGLELMLAERPNAKWFAILGDDVWVGLGFQACVPTYRPVVKKLSAFAVVHANNASVSPNGSLTFVCARASFDFPFFRERPPQCCFCLYVRT